MSRPAGAKFELTCCECGTSFTAGNTIPKRCPTCRANEKRQYYRDYKRERRTDPEFAQKGRDMALAYHRAHRDERLAYFKATHRQRRLVRIAWDEANQQHIHAYGRRKSREEWANKTGTYHKNHELYLQSHRAAEQARRARKAKVGGSWSSQEFRDLCEACGWRCAYCGVADNQLTADHLIPLSRGGSNAIENILPACRSCNTRKNAHTPIEFCFPF